MHHLDYPTCETSNHWRSVDAHFQDGAGSVWVLVLHIKKANTSVMTICNLWSLRLPKMQDKNLLTLCWLSFPGWGRERISPFSDHKGSQYIHKEQLGPIINILWLSVGYLNATINRTTWTAELEIWPDRSSQTWWHLQVDKYGAGFGLPRSCGPGCWMVLELNRTVFRIQSQTAGMLPGPVANSTP